MKKITIIIVILSILLFIVFSSYYQISVQNKALSGLNLQLTGIVDSVHPLQGFNGSGILKIRILQSNVKYYDPIEKKPYYYCLIKNGFAEVYDSHTEEALPGDTLQIDTNKKQIKWLNIDKKDHDYIIWVNTNDGFYSYLKTHFQRL